MVLTEIVMKSSIFWDITPCSPLKLNRHFGETYRLRIYVRRKRQARNQHEAGKKQNLCLLMEATYFFETSVDFEQT
jgi:hypothetical protein